MTIGRKALPVSPFAALRVTTMTGKTTQHTALRRPAPLTATARAPHTRTIDRFRSGFAQGRLHLHHDIHMTAKKIARRLALIAPLAYRRCAPLPPLRFKQLAGPTTPPPLDPPQDGAGWQVVLPNTYWGGHNVN